MNTTRVLLIGMLLGLPVSESALAQAQLTKLKQAALEIPAGSPVEVRTATEKLRGRLTEVADEGVTLQTVNAGKIEKRTVPFTEMKGLKLWQKRSPLVFVTGVMTMIATAGAITAAVRK